MDSQSRRRERRQAKQAAWRAANPLQVGVRARPVSVSVVSSSGCGKSRVEKSLSPINLNALAEYQAQLEMYAEAIQRRNHRIWYRKPRNEHGVTCSVGAGKIKKRISLF
ncbi:antitermination protein N [Entomohabitans teleogrylli]|uniref:antitermination protein N n=1 Tax=Entomohabitans teleogrylli TaxID=1384589 RepID=UPI00073D8A85|nr:antitermination protein N [Entomohabitans teleogrylli]